MVGNRRAAYSNRGQIQMNRRGPLNKYLYVWLPAAWLAGSVITAACVAWGWKAALVAAWVLAAVAVFIAMLCSCTNDSKGDY